MYAYMHYTINGCVLTDILYSYILDKHIGMTNVKKKYTGWLYSLR